jgi:DNA-binding Xre family transcriptional regulator
MTKEYTEEVVLSIQDQSTIHVKLKEAMERYSASTGQRLTYAHLASLTGVAQATIESLATRRGYNPTLKTLARLCAALQCTPGDLLELEQRAMRTSRRTRDK